LWGSKILFPGCIAPKIIPKNTTAAIGINLVMVEPLAKPLPTFCAKALMVINVTNKASVIKVTTQKPTKSILPGL
jgi:hypothetical protein